MSSQTVTNNTNNQLFINTDTSKIFIGENHTRKSDYINNSSYDPKVLNAGTVMGRISATGVLAPFNAAASDGTQYVVGILGNDLSIDAGATVKASIVVAGKVAKEKVIFDISGQSMVSVTSGRQAQDKIGGESVGILLVDTIQMSDYDNS